MTQKTSEYKVKHFEYLAGGLSDREETALLEEMDDLWYSMTPQEIEWCNNNLAPQND